MFGKIKTFISKDKLTNVFFIILGSLLSAISMNLFYINAHLIDGGVTGIALMCQYLLNIQAGYVILVINIPLFMLSYKKLNNKFTGYSLIGVFSFSISLIFTRFLTPYLVLNDKLMLCVYGGILNGFGCGLVFSHFGSIGGFDIISMIIKKKKSHIDLAKISFFIDLIVASIGTLFFGLVNGMYTLIAIYISSYVMNKVLKGLTSAKLVLVVTDKEVEMAAKIVDELDYGVTNWSGEGAYTRSEKQIVYCVVPATQLPELKSIIFSCDNSALITILDVSETIGKGFRRKL